MEYRINYRVNQNQMEGFARVSDNLASLSIASLAAYLTGYLKITIMEGVGLFFGIAVCLTFGMIFRRREK